MAYSLLSRLLLVGRLPHQSRLIALSQFEPTAGGDRVTPREQTASTAGFSILEMIVIVIIVGILASIAAPGWLTLMNRQRLISARDEVLQAVRTTQTEAKRTRRPELLTFDPSSPIPKVQGIELGSGNLKDDMVDMAIEDSAGTAVADITFDQNGAISEINGNPDVKNWPIKIVLSTSFANGPKRCIFVDSLLVSTRLQADTDCN